MKIDLRGGSPRRDGFGVAGRTIYRTLESIGHEIDPDADIQFVFTHPHNFVAEAEYNIGYFPWESSMPIEGWRRKMRKMDEIWVTSPIMVDYVREWGFDPYVYQHGINAQYEPRHRFVKDKITFIHQGLEAYRKGGHDAMAAFSAAFVGRDDVRLIMKTASDNIAIDTGRMKTENTMLTQSELFDLYYDCHVMLAPSYGEGFGIPALDAISTGMPTLMTEGVFPHEEFVDPDYSLIKSSRMESQWPEHHPGMMWKPDFDDLVDKMRFIADNYENVAESSMNAAKVVHERATWEVRTREAFDALEARLNSRASDNALSDFALRTE